MELCETCQWPKDKCECGRYWAGNIVKPVREAVSNVGSAAPSESEIVFATLLSKIIESDDVVLFLPSELRTEVLNTLEDQGYL